MTQLDIHTVRFGALYLALGVLLAVVLSGLGVKSWILLPIHTVQGVSIFAVAYLDAQFIERIVEPFSDLGGKTKESKQASPKKPAADSSWFEDLRSEPFGKWREIDTLEQEAARKGKRFSADKSERLALLKAQRAFSIWGFSSLLGILLAYFTFGLFQIVNIGFAGGLGRALDSILSGVIIGGGTKPLHDGIQYIEKSS